MSVGGMLERHPLSFIFPALGVREMEELVEDIRVRGLLEPIRLYEGKVLDGWHRYLACQRLNVAPKFQQYVGSDPVGFIWSKNGLRRHLSESQRAICLVELVRWKNGAGRPKMAPREPIHGESDANQGVAVETSNGDVNQGVWTVSRMAKVAEVGRETIKRAKNVVKGGSEELRRAVKEGEVSVREATQRIKGGARSPSASESLKEEYGRLKEEYERLRTHAELLADELAAVEAFRNQEAVKKIFALEQDLRLCVRRRGELMNENAELKRQVAYWRKRAEKLG